MEITLRTKPDKIKQVFIDAFGTSATVNLKTDFGWIYYVGGTLSKLVGRQQYVAINNEWVAV